MDNSNSDTVKIYPPIDGISNSIEKDLPASKSTGSISDGDDDEKNLDQQEDSALMELFSQQTYVLHLFQILLSQVLF